jgi:DNA-binding GntR family transcriptional regulator
VYVGFPDLSGVQVDVDFRERRITADYVADALREAIQRGDLADGAVLNQAAIAVHFGVSRVPIREAMRQLQAEGLIETRAHRLAIVRGLDLERLIEVYELRALLEGFLVERAVPGIDEERLRELRTIEHEMREEDDHVRWLELNARFHRLLYEPSGRVTTLELIDQLRARAERYVRLWSRGSGIHRPVEAGSEHARILELVARGDGPGARQAIEQHVAHTRDRVVAAGRAAGPEGDAGASAPPQLPAPA